MHLNKLISDYSGVVMNLELPPSSHRIPCFMLSAHTEHLFSGFLIRFHCFCGMTNLNEAFSGHFFSSLNLFISYWPNYFNKVNEAQSGNLSWRCDVFFPLKHALISVCTVCTFVSYQQRSTFMNIPHFLQLHILLRLSFHMENPKFLNTNVQFMVEFCYLHSPPAAAPFPPVALFSVKPLCSTSRCRVSSILSLETHEQLGLQQSSLLSSLGSSHWFIHAAMAKPIKRAGNSSCDSRCLSGDCAKFS